MFKYLLLFKMKQKKNIEAPSQLFLEEIELFKQRDEERPPEYAEGKPLKCYQCPEKLRPDAIPGAFRPPTIPSGMWSYKNAIQLQKGNLTSNDLKSAAALEVIFKANFSLPPRVTLKMA